jgi:S1-C subfamily serine protease
MTLMLRALVLATLFFVIPGGASGQALSVLHIKVALLDAEGKATPVPRHALLISDNPATTVPRRIVTRVDGTADVSLRPGNYTVESDQPVAFLGKAYQWAQIVDVASGRDATLELTAGNAEVEAVTSATTTSPAALEADPSVLLTKWQDSVVALWTSTTHASGFVVDARGLIATNQRVIGTATSVEVQLTPALKVAGSVLVADRTRDVAIVRIDPRVLGSVQPVPLGCALTSNPPLVGGQEIVTIGAPLGDPKGVSSGTVRRVESQTVVSDFILEGGSAGGPVFTVAGGVVGITSIADENDNRRRADSRVVRIDEACDVVASAEKMMMDAAPPSGAHLPVEPVRPWPVDALKDAAQKRAGNLSPYPMSSSDFDISFITPVLAYGALGQTEQPSGPEPNTNRREPNTSARRSNAERPSMSPIMDFTNWSEYVARFPPVLLIRLTPKLVEGFWTTVARGAAQTQGVSLPPIKHVKAGFSRMRALCGDAEVTPIHPFRLEQRVSGGDAIYEGLYVFDPSALGPECGTVKLVLYSEKAPEKGDTRVVDPKVLQQIWQDFTPYRDLK